MLGCVAAVMAMVSPSQPRPAVIHRISISEMASERRCAGSRFKPGSDMAVLRNRIHVADEILQITLNPITGQESEPPGWLILYTIQTEGRGFYRHIRLIFI